MSTAPLTVLERLRALEVQLDGVETQLASEVEGVLERAKAVEDRASADAKFVRRILYAAGAGIGGILIAAAMIIYQAGERSAKGHAQAEAARVEMLYKFALVDSSLTELKAQAKLLLEAQLQRDTAP